MHGLITAGAGGSCLPGSGPPPSTWGRGRNPEGRSKVGIEVALGVAIGFGAAKALGKVKEKIKRRFVEEVKSALEEDEQSQ